MDQQSSLGYYSFGKASVLVYATKQELGAAAAQRAEKLIAAAIEKYGKARIIVATGNSQLEVSTELVKRPGIDWASVEVFHMDEYAGISQDHPSSFRYWIRNRIEKLVHPAKVHYLAGDAADIEAEIERYSKLLTAEPIHLAFVGFGENGHIAFNDPPVADFNDPATVKRVILDEPCRRQQAGEGHFESFAAVPKEALTITCPGLFRAEAWVSCVADTRKAQAVKDALEGPLSTTCPASIVRTHPNASVYLDSASAELLSQLPVSKES